MLSMSNVEMQIVVSSLVYNYDKNERETIVNGIKDKNMKEIITSKISSLTVLTL